MNNGFFNEFLFFVAKRIQILKYLLRVSNQQYLPRTIKPVCYFIGWEKSLFYNKCLSKPNVYCAV